MICRSHNFASTKTLAVSALWLLFLVRALAADGSGTPTVSVDNSRELVAAVRKANKQGGKVTISLNDGIYTLKQGLNIRAPGVSLVSASGDRSAVVVEGDGMRADAKVGNVITVNANDFLLDGVTLQNARYHAIQIKGENGANRPTIRNCVIRDTYEQLMKVTRGKAGASHPSEHGIVENCVFEYSAGIGPQHYIGGIDAHGANDWIVRNNTFRYIISPGRSVAQYAIHFWNESAGNIVEKNLIIDCDRGIGFGLGKRGNTGGVIRNNMIYHSANNGRFADVGIAIQNSPETHIYNNTIFQEHSYSNAIEFKFAGTQDVVIENNLTNRRIRGLKGASARLVTNNTQATGDMFVDLASGDLSLRPTSIAPIDQGTSIDGLTDDFGGDPRPLKGGVDIGADEHNSNAE